MRISRISVPSGWSTGGTSRQSRSCSESVTRPQAARASGSRIPMRNQRMAQCYAKRPVSSPNGVAAAAGLPLSPHFLHNLKAVSMPESEPRRIGLNVEVKPHAYDPAAQPELFEGVLARRVVAFIIDIIVIAVPLLFLGVFIFMFGLVTLGLGWFLFLFYSPIAVIWALVYYGLTLGSAASATIGMRMVDL